MPRAALSAALGLALPLALAAPAQAHWEYTRWGMTVAQVVAASRGAVTRLPAGERRAIPTARMDYRAAGSFRAGGVTLDVAFAFDGRNGGLLCVSAQAAPDQAPALRARLIRLFGQPQERGTDPATGGENLGWARPDEIDLQIVPGRPVILLHCARGV